MSANPHEYSKLVLSDAFFLLAGSQIGTGMTRDVFECAIDPDCVVKIEDRNTKFQNVLEWEIWHNVKETPFAKWFAPCLQISPCGIALIQKRTMTIPDEKYPQKVPAFFTDLKRQNFGWYKGHLACHDYGVSLMLQEGMTKRLKNANWWSET